MELAERNAALTVENAQLRWKLFLASTTAVGFGTDVLRATRDVSVLNDLMHVLASAVRADRLVLFRLNERSKCVVIAGFGPNVPGPGDFLRIDDRQAVHALQAWTGTHEFLRTPTPGVGFDSYWGVKDGEGTVIAVLGIDDTGDTREFNDAEVGMMRDVVALIAGILRA